MINTGWQQKYSIKNNLIFIASWYKDSIYDARTLNGNKDADNSNL